jgi:hypothetical protein
VTRGSRPKRPSSSRGFARKACEAWGSFGIENRQPKVFLFFSRRQQLPKEKTIHFILFLFLFIFCFFFASASGQTANCVRRGEGRARDGGGGEGTGGGRRGGEKRVCPYGRIFTSVDGKIRPWDKRGPTRTSE